MMRRGTGTLLLAIVVVTASSLFSLTSALNKVCINANSEVQRVWCDEVEYTHLLPNRKEAKCDCIFMPVCKILAIKAKGNQDGQKSLSGINVCQTMNPTPYQDWVCHRRAARIQGQNWYKMAFNHNPRRWKRAVKPDDHCVGIHCHDARHRPCRGTCFWNKFGPGASIDCVTKQCQQDCLSCVQTGPGNCDPGQCRWGTGVNTVTKATLCQHKCTVEWRAWGGASGKGYIKLIDGASGSMVKFVADVTGLYLAVIDVTQCNFIWKNFTTWNKDNYNSFLGSGGYLLTWSGDQTGPNRNNIAVSLGVGAGTLQLVTTVAAPSPAFAMYKLGQGVRTFLINAATNGPIKNQCLAQAHLTGVTNGNVTLDSYTYSNPCY